MKWIIDLVSLMSCLSLVIPAILGNPKLLFANRKDIRVIDIQKGKLSKTILVKDVNDAASVDFYYKKRQVCWTDIGKEFIKCVSLNEKNKDHKQIKLITHGIISPDGMAVDWISEKIYWADSETDKLEVAELYGPHRTLLYWKDLDQPRAVALVPSEGFIFWTDWGRSPKIERASMDGDESTRKIIVDQDILWPNGLTVDYENRRLFWADGKAFSIFCSDFDGSNKIKVISKLKHPFALSYLKQTLYWTDWSTEVIHYCSLNSKAKCEHPSQLSVKLSPLYLHVYDQSRQLDSENPCGQNNGGCSHLCLLSSGQQKFSCACPTGVILRNRSHCDDGPNEMLLLARRSDLRRISLDTPDYTPVVLPVRNVRHAIAVDYDPVDQYFYWTDDEAFWIQRAQLDGSKQEVVVHSQGLDSDGIAIDFLARNIYWSDAENNRIEVAKLDGTSRKILLRNGLDKPRAIALFPEGGLMFWTDWGEKPKIERANLDGSDRVVVVGVNLGWPNGVAIDVKANKIYWVDASTRVIEVAGLDGSNRRVILEDNLPHVFGFSLLGDYLYWTDWQRRSVERIHKDNETSREVLLNQLPDVMGLKALSVHQELGFSPCAQSNGGCSHLCFNRPSHQYICDCPLGYELASDEKNCVLSTAFVLYTQHEEIRRISLETFQEALLPIPGVKEASSIDFDAEGRLYWPSLSDRKIFRSFMNGSFPEVVVEFGLGYSQGLAVDWIAQNLYWADMMKNRIEVSRLDGSNRRILLCNVTEPKDLAVNPFKGILYWSEWADNATKIMQSHMDGSNPEAFVSQNIGRVTGLTLDYKGGKLYWMDIDLKRIESSFFNGSHRQVVVDYLYQPNGLAQYEDFIYWSDWQWQIIQKAHKETGDNITIVKKYREFVNDLTVFITSREVMDHPCRVDYGNCTHLCIPTPSPAQSSVCLCPTHYTLQEDGITCLQPKDFLLFSEKSSVIRLVFGNEECPTTVLALPNMRNVSALSFDSLHSYIIWIDSKTKLIRRANQNGGNAEVIVKRDKIDPFDLAVDSGSQTVFWSCASNNIINGTRTDGVEIGTILGLEGKDKPRSLALHSTLGILFFANMISSPVIEKLILNGLIRQVVISSELRNPTSLVIDPIDDALYWVDSNPASISVADLDGRNRKILIDPITHDVSGVTVHGQYLYWLVDEVVERANKLTGQERDKVFADGVHLTAITSATFKSFEDASHHPCISESAKCSHFCVLFGSKGYQQTSSFLIPPEPHGVYSHYEEESDSYRCECPQDMVLSSNSITCIPRPICPPKHFTCVSTQTCIPLQWRCDGLKECSDGSDEINCSPSSCDPSFFRCANGQCIDNSLVCDRNSQCTDDSDEIDCCPSGQSMCRSTGLCVSCSNSHLCPEGLIWCPIPMSFIPTDSASGNKTIWFISVFISVLLIIVGVGFWIYWQRKPAMLDDHEIETQTGLKGAKSRPYKVVLNGDKVYIGLQGDVGASCPHNTHIHDMQNEKLRPDVVTIGCSHVGVTYVEQAPGIGGVSSSSSSMTHYPRETLNPPPTPDAEPHSHCLEPHCYYPSRIAPPTSLNSYRHYKSHNRPPPPTPCSTDFCDDSDFYSSILSPQHSNCFSPTSTCCSSPPTDYDSDPIPPPPTPQMQYLASCTPSPSTDRSEFIEAPCPSPCSPSSSESPAEECH